MEILFKKIGDHPERNTQYTSDPLNITGSRARLDIRKNNFSARVPEKWNQLPAITKAAVNLTVFKNALQR